jgi:hypothetical protein
MESVILRMEEHAHAQNCQNRGPGHPSDCSGLYRFASDRCEGNRLLLRTTMSDQDLPRTPKHEITRLRGMAVC